MSEADGGPGRREVAYRLFAAEYDDADLSHSESDEERAPNYVVTPTGARVNRVFAVGVLTEVESVSEDYLRARVVDPTGPFVIYAGQYQPEAMRFLESADPPAFVAVTGKARTFQPEDSDRVYTSIRPESINEVDAETRDRWVIEAAEATIERVARVAEAKASGNTGEDLRAALLGADVPEGLAHGIPVALSHYDTTGEYLASLRELALDALRVVAGDRDEVGATLAQPAEGGDDPVADLAERTPEPVTVASTEAGGEATNDGDGAGTTPEPDTGQAVETGEGQSETATAEDTIESDSAESAADADPPTGDDDGPEETPDTGDEPPSTEAGEPETGDEPTPTEAGEPDTGDEPTPTEAGGTDSGEESAPTGAGETLGDFDLDEGEREEIESEYGTEFKSGSEVEEPGEADIETPAATESTESAATDGPATGDTEDADGSTESTEAGEDHGDLDDEVMAVMDDVDEGDGADREAVIAAVLERTGAGPDAVEDAIQDALMDGRCYEPEDGTLKPI